MTNLKKTFYIFIGISLAIAGTAYAVQISVPSAINAGKLLQSLSNGTYNPVSLNAGSNVTISTTTTAITISASGGGGTFPFTVNSWGNSTTSVLGFLNGFLSTASSTINSSLFMPALSQGVLYIGSSGLVNSIASSSLNVGTATALSANPTNCSAGNYPLGIDASGNVENCTVAGTITSIATNNGLTGGTITTTGTIGLDITKFSTNALTAWDGTQLIATGTPQLTTGNLLATSTTATSTILFHTMIGTSTPISSSNYILTVGNQAGETTSLLGITNGTGIFQIGFPTAGSGTAVIGTITNNSFGIRSNGTTRIQVTNGGFVGVGTTSPWGFLSVNPTALGSNVPEFVIGSTSATHFVVDGAGNVGVGTTSPGSLFSIGGQGVGINFGLGTTTYSTTGGINLLTSGCFAINSVCLSAFSNTIGSGGTGSTAFANNSIITSNAAGTALIATGTQLTVGNILATTTAVNTFGGVLVVPDGTCGSPSFSFSDDQNNGVYSPANDIFGICTNGLERFRIDDGTGRSMFGTTTAPLSSILTLATSTGHQLTFGDATSGDPLWAFRATGTHFYLSTTTVAGTASSTYPVLDIDRTGFGASFGSTSPSTLFSFIFGGLGSATSSTYKASGSGKGHCEVWADSDGVGVTYVSANNGVLTASTLSCL